MSELISRRAYLLAAIRADGRPVTSHLATQLMTDSSWPTTGRNTARKDLRALVASGQLLAKDDGGRRTYHLATGEDGRP